jgi:1,4-dihydroxy-2-naphthoyl-CoA hydrolase
VTRPPALRPGFTAERFNTFGRDYLPELIGLNILDVGEGFLKAELPIRKALLAPNGYLHAGTITTLADTAAGYACVAHLPDGASNFTTIELKLNFLGTARLGMLACEARALHLGRTTQVWEAIVRHVETAKDIALFSCTQMVLRR